MRLSTPPAHALDGLPHQRSRGYADPGGPRFRPLPRDGRDHAALAFDRGRRRIPSPRRSASVPIPIPGLPTTVTVFGTPFSWNGSVADQLHFNSSLGNQNGGLAAPVGWSVVAMPSSNHAAPLIRCRGHKPRQPGAARRVQCTASQPRAVGQVSGSRPVYPPRWRPSREAAHETNQDSLCLVVTAIPANNRLS